MVIHGFGHPGRITAIDDLTVTVYDDGLDDGDGNCEVNFAINEISPIEVTRELIEKNGFSRVFEFEIEGRKGVHIYQSDDKRILINDDENMTNTFNKWNLHVDTEDMSSMMYCELTYFHQLQQMLRYCGIEKEFKL